MNGIDSLAAAETPQALSLSCAHCAGSRNQKEQRAAHKFHKKPVRSKGTRGQSLDSNLYAEGTPFATGRKGGIKRELYT